MEAVPLEKAPKVAVYTPPDALPWDDAVTLALKYAGIEYTPIYDDEVERGDLSKYDWLHLHHEDFTGQLNKFYLTLPRRAVVHRSAAEEHGGGEATRLREHAGAQEGRRRTRFASSSSAADSCSRCAARRRRSSWRSPARTSTSRRASSTARRWIPTPTARWTGEAHARVPRRAPRAVAVRELDERHRRPSGQRARATPAARHVHAVQLLGEVRSGAVDARAGPSRAWSTTSSA